MLLLLVSGHRGQTVHLIDIYHMFVIVPEVTGSNAVEALIFSGFFFRIA